MIRLIFLVATLLFIFPEGVKAQELSYGFRVGLNASTISGDEEMDASGNTVENIDYNNGFHVGGGVRIEITELFGIRTEILFTQKGTKRNFEGSSYFIFDTPNGKVRAAGNKNVSLNISNAYLDIPILAYGKIGEKFEVFAGGYAGFLISSVATGELIFKDGQVEGNNNIIDQLDLTLDYNYLRDELGEVQDGIENITVMVDGENVDVPNTLTAYYDLDAKDGRPYKVFDAGVSAGAAYFLNGGLYFSAIANYGLIDVTRSNMDFSNTEIDGLNYQTRADKDNNLSFQFSLGFSF